MANPTAQEVIDAVVVEKYRPDARVIVSKSKEFGQHFRLKPQDIVPDDDELNTVFIHIVELSVPTVDRKPGKRKGKFPQPLKPQVDPPEDPGQDQVREEGSEALAPLWDSVSMQSDGPE